MKPTIIFMAGWCVPIFVMKSKWLFDDSMWTGYRRLWLPSPTPRSDVMVEKELERLKGIAWTYPDAVWVGHSLGGWWVANLALRVKLRKAVLWTPLCNEQEYPIFNVTPQYHPCNYQVNTGLTWGTHRVLVMGAKDDLIVPAQSHAHKLAIHFGAQSYHLLGGHFYQKNHQTGLQYMKEWLDI